MNTTRRALCSAAALSLTTPTLFAQEWPAKPIRIIVPYPAGGNADSASRVLAEAVSPTLKQPIIVDNRPGASSILGTEIVARAAPDGYTIGLVSDSHAINQALSRTSAGAEILGSKVPYDAIKDFVPICGVALVPLVLVVNPKVPARTVKEFAQYASTQKDKSLNFGTMGTGSPWFVNMHQLRKLLNTELVNVSYKGLAPAATDVVGGQIDTMVMPIHYAQQFIASGKLVPLAVTTAQRHPLLPNVPTLAESGYPGLEITNYLIYVAPAGTPPAIVNRLSEVFIAALKTPQVIEKFSLTGDPYPAGPAELAERIKRDVDVFGAVIAANVK